MIRKKMKSQGGFTLIEMMVVVAIIAILVAISIPAVSSSLETARKNTDLANERSAKAAAMISYMNGDLTTGNTANWYAYDGSSGEITGVMNTSTGKKATQVAPSSNGNHYGQCNAHSKMYIKIRYDDNGNFFLTWSNGTTDTGWNAANNHLVH